MPLREAMCYLQNVDDPNKKIYLPHKVKVPIGPIDHPFGCFGGYAHVFAMADLEEMKVDIENAGRGDTWMANSHLDLAGKKTLVHGDEIALENGEEIYIVKFDPPRTIENKPLKGEATKFLPVKKEAIETACKPKRGKGSWENVSNEILIYTPPDTKPTDMVAGFGLIGTLVKVKDRSTKHIQWNLTFDNIQGKLKGLQKDGYRIAIFSDNIITNKLHVSLFKKKIAALLRRIGVPIQVYMATGGAMNRKPLLGMWYALTKRNTNATVNRSKSFYVGSLGGRRKDWKLGAPADPSNADRLFAVNIGVKFFSPEEYFCQTPVAPYNFPAFNPRLPCTFNFTALPSKTKEVIVMVGPPDSGKTYICKKYLVPAGYVHISIDYVVEMLRSVQIIKNFLKEGKSIVVDAMNPSSDSRKVFTITAKKRCAKARCFHMKVSKEQLAHNRKFRELSQMRDGLKQDHRILTYDSFYEKPTKAEGFAEVIEVPFAPSFEDENLNVLYRTFLVAS